jgi:hypothetical protein
VPLTEYKPDEYGFSRMIAPSPAIMTTTTRGGPDGEEMNEAMNEPSAAGLM